MGEKKKTLTRGRAKGKRGAAESSRPNKGGQGAQEGKGCLKLRDGGDRINLGESRRDTQVARSAEGRINNLRNCTFGSRAGRVLETLQ